MNILGLNEKSRRDKNKLFPYFGGKDLMLKHILPLIPNHTIYLEPFCGGASVFFAKDEVYQNIINDLDNSIYDLYYTIKHDTDKFYKKLDCLPYSKYNYDKARRLEKIILAQEKGEKVEKRISRFSRGFNKFILLTHSVYHRCESFNCGKEGKKGYEIFREYSNPDRIKNHLDRIKRCILHNIDGIRFIETYDSKEAFIYIDPPYINTRGIKGVYNGFTEDDYRKLIETLKTVKGKFILSNIKENINNYFEPSDYGWNQKDIPMKMGVTSYNKTKGNKVETNKIESLVWNYDIKDSGVLF